MKQSHDKIAVMQDENVEETETSEPETIENILKKLEMEEFIKWYFWIQYSITHFWQH